MPTLSTISSMYGRQSAILFLCARSTSAPACERIYFFSKKKHFQFQFKYAMPNICKLLNHAMMESHDASAFVHLLRQIVKADIFAY